MQQDTRDVRTDAQDNSAEPAPSADAAPTASTDADTDHAAVLGGATPTTGVGFRGHSGGRARDSEGTSFANSGSGADGSVGTRDTSAPASRGSL